MCLVEIPGFRCQCSDYLCATVTLSLLVELAEGQDNPALWLNTSLLVATFQIDSQKKILVQQDEVYIEDWAHYFFISFEDTLGVTIVRIFNPYQSISISFLYPPSHTSE